MNIMDIDKMYSLACVIAKKAHEGQVDKGGNDYILHPKRVADMCGKTEEKVVAILHDTIEDTTITAESLLLFGFPEFIVEAVESVTRTKNEPYFNFIQRCKNNPIGRVVKVNDLKDNMNLTRLDSISEQDLERMDKYLKALRILI